MAEALALLEIEAPEESAVFVKEDAEGSSALGVLDDAASLVGRLPSSDVKVGKLVVLPPCLGCMSRAAEDGTVRSSANEIHARHSSTYRRMLIGVLPAQATERTAIFVMVHPRT